MNHTDDCALEVWGRECPDEGPPDCTCWFRHPIAALERFIGRGQWYYLWFEPVFVPSLSLGFHAHFGWPHLHLDLHLPFLIILIGNHGMASALAGHTGTTCGDVQLTHDDDEPATDEARTPDADPYVYPRGPIVPVVVVVPPSDERPVCTGLRPPTDGGRRNRPGPRGGSTG